MLRIYLNKRLIKLETDNQIEDNLQRLNKYPFRFTGKKVSLVELGYSLASSGDFNNGNVEIKEMMNFLSTVFIQIWGLLCRIYRYERTKRPNSLSSSSNRTPY